MFESTVCRNEQLSAIDLLCDLSTRSAQFKPHLTTVIGNSLHSFCSSYVEKWCCVMQSRWLAVHLWDIMSEVRSGDSCWMRCDLRVCIYVDNSVGHEFCRVLHHSSSVISKVNQLASFQIQSLCPKFRWVSLSSITPTSLQCLFFLVMLWSLYKNVNGAHFNGRLCRAFTL